MEKKLMYGIAAIVAVIVIIGLALIAVPAISGAFTLQGQQTTKETVRMGNLPVIQGLPVYLAIDKNYFEEAGIHVEIVKLEAPNQIIDGLMQDKLDMTTPSGAAGISAVANYKNPGKIQIYALSGGTTDAPAEAILVPVDSTITSIKELKGKKLGIIGGSLQWRLLAQYMLEENGLVSDKDVTIVELSISNHVSALAAKQIDALLAIEPTISIALQNKTGKMLVNGPLETTLADPFYPGAGIISTKFMKEHPETAKIVIEIINRANKEIEANPTEARTHFKGYTALNDSLAASVILPRIITCDELTTKDIAGLQKFYDIFTDYNAVVGHIDAHDILSCTKRGN